MNNHKIYCFRCKKYRTAELRGSVWKRKRIVCNVCGIRLGNEIGYVEYQKLKSREEKDRKYYQKYGKKSFIKNR